MRKKKERKIKNQIVQIWMMNQITELIEKIMNQEEITFIVVEVIELREE